MIQKLLQELLLKHILTLHTAQASAPSHYELINKAYVTEEEIRERPDEVYEAEEDYRGRGDGELTFLRGAIIKNVEQDPDHVGWLVWTVLYLTGSARVSGSGISRLEIKCYLIIFSISRMS